MTWTFDPIGTVESCFKEKFGIPRQPGLVTQAQAVIQIKPDPFLKTALREIDRFSHLWVIFVFHRADSKNWKPSIRPPRLGGAQKVGVLASRSPHRPNPIGLSAVKLLSVDFDFPNGPRLTIQGGDLLEGTPVLDIKPYLPYADSISDAMAGWAESPIERTPVRFTEQAERSLDVWQMRCQHPDLRALVLQMLELDPRPAFQKRKLPPDAPEAQDTRYGFRLFDFDVKWRIWAGAFEVLDLVEWEEPSG